MLNDYLKHVEERKSQDLPPSPLERSQVQALIPLVENPPKGQETLIRDLVTNRIPPGVDPAAQVKAELLENIATGRIKTPLFTAEEAVALLGTMLGGYNVRPLVSFLENQTLAPAAVKALSRTLLVLHTLKDIISLSQKFWTTGRRRPGSQDENSFPKSSPSPCSRWTVKSTPTI